MEGKFDNPAQAACGGHQVFLIWGGDGWIAGLLHDLLVKQGKQVYETTVRMENREAVLKELDKVQPTHVFNCAGVTGRPNVDWCEDNKEATVRSNVIGTLNLADCCFIRGIHCSVFATGCIYTYNASHPMHSSDPGKPPPGFTEIDPPNFTGSFYSLTKSHTEAVLRATYPNVLVLRLRMPVSADLHPRSFLTKITRYARVVDVPNSHTLLPDLLPCAVLLAAHDETGTYNFTNPGALSHNQVLSLYRDVVDPTFRWRNFGLAEQAEVIRAGRSNCRLDTTKLERKMAEYGVVVPGVREAWSRCLETMADGMAEGPGKENRVPGREGVKKGQQQQPESRSAVEEDGGARVH